MKRAALRFDTMEDVILWVASRKKPPPQRPCPTEEEEQMRLIAWKWEAMKQYPELSLLHAIPNGSYRLKHQAVRLAHTGTLAGIPDLALPVARKGAHSLYLEMKALDGSISTLQIERAVQLVDAGNCVAFAWGWQMARDVLVWYLDKKGDNTK